jgi:hypothetical protein
MPNTNFSIKSYFDQLDQSQQSFRTLMGLFSPTKREDEGEWGLILNHDHRDDGGLAFSRTEVPIIDHFLVNDDYKAFKAIMMHGTEYDTDLNKIAATDFHICFSDHMISTLDHVYNRFNYYDNIECVNIHKLTSRSGKTLKASIDVEDVIPLKLTRQGNHLAAYYFYVKMYSYEFGTEYFAGFAFHPNLENDLLDIFNQKRWLRRTFSSNSFSINPL